MVDKVEQFVLSLKGWKYKGILHKWFYGISDPIGPTPYHGFVSEDWILKGTYIPGDMVIRKEGTTTSFSPSSSKVDSNVVTARLCDLHFASIAAYFVLASLRSARIL